MFKRHAGEQFTHSGTVNVTIIEHKTWKIFRTFKSEVYISRTVLVELFSKFTEKFSKLEKKRIQIQLFYFKFKNVKVKFLNFIKQLF